MTIDKEFDEKRRDQIDAIGQDEQLGVLTRQWLSRAQEKQYSYHFDWLGLPIIQYPQDIVAMQEIVWSVKPDLIVETGIARGGSVVFYASMLELLAICGHGDGSVLAVDIDIRPHNRQSIAEHPLARRIDMIEGPSIAADTIAQVKAKAEGKERILVCLDSNHTHDHVLEELRAYASLASVGSYVVVFDTLVEDLSAAAIGDRSWGKGNNPKTAVWAFLEENDCFEIDRSIHDKLQISVAPDGFLKRVR
jgi:cephalosporin hydroxylase